MAPMRSVLETRYADLVRMAYLILDDGRADAERLLATAHRVVWETVRPGLPATADSDESYIELRGRLLGRLIGGVRSRRRLIGWLRARPEALHTGEASPEFSATSAGPRPRPRDRGAAGEHRRPQQGKAFGTDRPRDRRPGAAVPRAGGPGLRAALREVSRHERVVYLLSRLDNLSPVEVAAELGPYLAVAPGDVHHTAAAITTATGLSEAEQRAELAGFDPTLVRLQPGEPGRRRLLAVAIVVALGIVGGAGYAGWRGDDAAGEPLVVDADQWRGQRSPGLSMWPTEGDRRSDRELLRRARAAWFRTHLLRPLGPVTVIFAGTAGDSTIVVMHDAPGSRAAPTVANYAERPLSRGVESIRRLAHDTAPILWLDPPSGRLLIPPWRTDLHVASLTQRSPRWRRLAIRDGVSEPVPTGAFSPDCYFTIAVRLADLSGEPVTQLVSSIPEWASPQLRVWDHTGTGATPAVATAGWTAWSWRLLRTMVCSAGISVIEEGDLRIGRLWHGPLPGGGGLATLAVVGSSGDAAGRAMLLADTGRPLAVDGASNSDYATAGDEVAGAVWWWSDRTRRWYLVVARTPHLARLEVVGELGRHVVRGRSLILPGPPAGSAARLGREPPVVQVVAYEPDGDRTIITP